MKVHNGIDIIEIERVKQAIEKNGQHFVDRIFTPEEQAYCENRGRQKYASYAARFAAKEAVSKAIGQGFSEYVNPVWIEVLPDLVGKPLVVFKGKTKDYFKNIKVISFDISLSHSDGNAIAVFTMLTED